MGSYWKKTLATLVVAPALLLALAAPPALAAPGDPGLVNVALASYGTIATSSGLEVAGSNTEDLAIDGDVNTRWSSNKADDAQLTLKLAQPALISHMVINWKPVCAKKYTLQVSTDNALWTNATPEITPVCGSTDTQVPTLLDPAAKYQYVRMQANGRTAIAGVFYGVSLSEFQVWSTPPVVPVLENKIPQSSISIQSASSQELTSETAPNGPAVALLDGNPATHWHSKYSAPAASYPHNVVFNLGQSYAVSGFQFTQRTFNSGRIKNYEVYVSDNLANFGTAVTTGVLGNTAIPQILAITGGKVGRYVKFVGLTPITAGQAFASGAEVNIAGALPPALAAAEETVQAGSDLAITLTNFPADTNVAIAAGGSTLKTVATTATGGTNFNLTIPADTSAGLVTITATAGTVVASKAVTVTAAPSLSISAPSVQAGSSATATVNRFPAATAVEIRLGSSVLATITTDAAGAGSASITIPTGTAANNYTLSATAGSKTATTTLGVTPAPALTFANGNVVQAGSALNATVTSFPAGATVQFTLNSSATVLGTLVADISGAASGNITIPSDTTAGNHNLVATAGATTATKQISVTAAPVVSNAVNLSLASLGATVTYSGNETTTSNLAGSVIDGNTTTRWSSNGADNAWVAVKLRRPINIEKVVIKWEAACAAKYKLQVSTDGINYVDATAEIAPTCGTTDTRTIKPELAGNSYQFIKMQGIDRTPIGGQKWGISLFELEVWGAPNDLVSLVPQSQISIAAVSSQEMTGETAPSGLATAMLDGNPATFWHTKYTGGVAAYPHQVTFDLHNYYSVAGFEFTQRNNAGTRIKGYELYVSNDLNNFGTPVATGELLSILPVQLIDLPSGKVGRYVKLVGLSSYAGTAFGSGAEVNIRGTLAPHLEASTNSVQAGDQFTASVVNFPAATPVSITWAGAALGTITTAADGSGSKAFIIPASTVAGTQALAATAGSLIVTTPLTVTAAPAVSVPGPVQAGSDVTVNVANYPATTAVEIRLGATLLGTITTAADGSGSKAFTIATNTAPGSLTITAIAGTKTASTPLTVTPAPAVTTTAGTVQAGSPVTVNVAYYPTTTAVEIKLGTTVLGSITTAADGTGSKAFTIAAGTTPGNLTITATAGTKTATTPLTVTPAPAVSTTAGTVQAGSDVTVNVANYPATTAVEIRLGATLLGTITTAADGSGSKAFTIATNTAPGSLTITAIAGSKTASTPLTVTPAPVVTTSGTVQAGSDVTVNLANYPATTAVEIKLGTTVLGSITTAADGTGTKAFTIATGTTPGSLTITATAGSKTASTPLTVTPAPAVTTTAGTVQAGSDVTVNVANYPATTAVEIRLGTTVLGSITTAADGTGTKAFTIPSLLTADDYTIIASAGTKTASVTVRVTSAPAVTTSASTVQAGSSTDVSIANYPATTAVEIKLGTTVLGSITTAADGTGTKAFTIAAGTTPGNLSITATAGTKTASTPLTVTPAPAVTTAGTVQAGSPVTVNLANYPATTAVEIKLGTTVLGSITTAADGTGTKAFTIPASTTAGNLSITATAGTKTATTTLIVTSAPVVTTSASTVQAGSSTDVSIANYPATTAVEIKLGTTVLGSITTAADGTGTKAFTIAAGTTPGNLSITATVGTKTATTALIVTSAPVVTTSASTVQAGSSTDVSIANYPATTAVEIKLGTTVLGSITTAADGTGTKAFTIAAGTTPGNLSITATAGTKTASTPLTVTPAPAVTTTAGTVQAGGPVTVNLANYPATTAVEIKLGTTVLGSITTAADGTGTKAFTIPASTTAGNLSITATAGTKTATTTLIVTSSPAVTLPSEDTQAGDDLKVSVEHFPADTEVTVSLGGVVLATITTDSNGVGTATVKVPRNTPAGTVDLVVTDGTKTATIQVDVAAAPAVNGPGTSTEVPSIQAGKKFELTLSGFPANSDVSLVLHSTPVLLGTVTTKDDGTVTTTVTIPASTEAGAHTIVASAGSKTASLLVQVSAADKPSPSPSTTKTPASNAPATTATSTAGDLASTGSTSVALALAMGGLLLVMAGAGTLLARRSRRSAH
ncbi:discoidin domain-containing protein [Arthrobacter glacialis]|uniref:discoidin domain-containing protein n=1 Tax=Arthrobacter glacialis TaxID=1664 RepID=UPI0013FDDDB0|nr:discoidin domain-containing protein [Arthrobacter glacialis]